MTEVNETKINDNFSNAMATSPIAPVNKSEINFDFDNAYNQALNLMAGDKLLKPYASNAIIRNTSTQGVYKVLSGNQIKILDESQLFRNNKYAAGSISKLNDNEYEIVSFDEDGLMEINHFDKNSTIEFLKEHQLTL